jgi:hypothetical protein
MNILRFDFWFFLCFGTITNYRIPNFHGHSERGFILSFLLHIMCVHISRRTFMEKIPITHITICLLWARYTCFLASCSCFEFTPDFFFLTWARVHTLRISFLETNNFDLRISPKSSWLWSRYGMHYFPRQLWRSHGIRD